MEGVVVRGTRVVEAWRVTNFLNVDIVDVGRFR